ncbi:hypothetical protein KTT_28630 [Tengunoibacter tsumagoiensis]|uniref:Uncharacterized protein n=1 Tax=Tengunoibacter tsumagoiensis TaxID=2014871 RepID=A0A402A1K6_9CHLR|nr:hypothetical protein KTT_28630 [Tengunoibacter tsumagoiensis]
MSSSKERRFHLRKSLSIVLTKGFTMCAVSAHYQFPYNMGEEESKTSSRTPAYFARKLKENKSML